MMKKYLSLLLIIVLVFLILGGCAQSGSTTPATTQATASTDAAKPIKLVFSEFEMAGSSWDTEIAKPWFAELEKRTGGRVQVEQHFGGELAGLFDVYDAVLKGTVDFAKIFSTMYAADKFPMDGVLVFPPVNVESNRPGQVWMDLYNKFPEMQAAYNNSPLLGFAPQVSGGVSTRGNIKINTYTDLKGLKFPGTGSASDARKQNLGMTLVSLPPPDVYMALKTGTLDGVCAGLPSLRDFKWVDVVPNVSLVHLDIGCWVYVMNKQKWDSLPKDIQQTFIDLRPWLTELNDRVQAKLNQEALSQYPKEFGTNFIRPSQADLDKWAEVDRPTLDAYITGVNSKNLPGNALKDEFLKLWSKYAASEYAFK
jgi:TRAP-type transport system periplasmic protein